MAKRNIDFKNFIAGTMWQSWDQTPLAVDASSRTYTRLTQDSKSVIVMDAPPKTSEDTGPFILIANTLKEMGLAAPRILKQDIDNGFLVLEDLGPTDFATHIRQNPHDTTTLYRSAADILVHLHKQPTQNLSQLTPKVAGEMVKIVTEHYIEAPEISVQLAQAVSRAMAANCGSPQHLALRDFHAENLIWRASKSGLARVGLLDFQDAFNAPAGYDLASLLRDARHDVPCDIAATITRQFANQTGIKIDDLRCALATLAVQRNLRILGVFARLIRIAGKPRYGAMMPRVWAHLQSDLKHPAIAELKDLIDQAIPCPKDAGFS